VNLKMLTLAVFAFTACVGIPPKPQEIALADWIDSTPLAGVLDAQDVQYVGLTLNLNPRTDEITKRIWKKHKTAQSEIEELMIGMASGPMQPDNERVCREFVLILSEHGEEIRKRARGFACRPSNIIDPGAWIVYDKPPSRRGSAFAGYVY
jgi:hypothetical protein